VFLSVAFILAAIIIAWGFFDGTWQSLRGAGFQLFLSLVLLLKGRVKVDKQVWIECTGVRSVRQ